MEIDVYDVYTPHFELIREDGYGPTLQEVIIAGYNAFGIAVPSDAVETNYRDSYEE